jgi:dTDP-4-dehydrorhamnose reductase
MSDPPTIAVLGCEGQLGAELVRQLGAAAIPLSRRDCDICDARSARTALLRASPTIVLNAAGYTKVDLAQRDEAACMRANGDAVENLAKICNELKAKLVQISTDYVFGGDLSRRQPYREDDSPSPQSVYARSKLAGELAAATWEKHLIVRTCGLYGPRTKPSQTNFVDTILRLARQRDRLRIVDDQHCTPSSVQDVAAATIFLAISRNLGIYHVVNAGSTTWYHFACEAFRLAGITVPIEPITTAQYGAAAGRPAYSVLDVRKYDLTGGPRSPSWQAALEEYLRRVENIPASGKPNQVRAA